MIYFITNEPQHLKLYKEKLYDNIVVKDDSPQTFNFFEEWVNSNIAIDNNIVGYDVESNGLDAWVNKTILKIIGSEDIQFIFHVPFCSVKKYIDILIYYEFIFLGHNIKFDLKFLITEDNIFYNKVYDTMLAEQRLYMKSRLPMGLADLAYRYLKVYPDAMDKNIRNEFIGVNIKTFKIKPRHLYYAAGDVSNLFPIKEKQEILLERYNLTNLVKDIEFPMISIIAKAELTGFKFNTEEWLNIYEENLDNKFKLECILDEEVRKLRDKVWGTPDEPFGYNKEKKMYMTHGKWDNTRKLNPLSKVFNKDGTTNVLDLFGETMSKKALTGVKKKVDLYPNNLNYSSDTQIIEIFARLEEPLLTKQDTLVIPQFNKRQKIDKTYHSFQTNEPALHAYLKLLPNTIMETFIETLLKHRGLDKAVSTYGANFVNKINPITNKIHTSFRQCFTETGRMSSGGGKKESDKPNFQNIPSKADFAIRMRNCFMADEGYSIGTHDLSGAELIIMCSLSQDMKLLEASKGDMHSYVAQNCWRRIYAKRAKDLIKQHDALREVEGKDYTDVDMVKQINEYIKLSQEYIVDKTCKKVRTAFKPMTFGVIYGMYATKAGKTLNISKEEGQIVINFIENEFPDVIRMVKSASAFARANGYIILNDRTNSRAWFPSIIKALRENLDFSDYRTRQAYPILSAKVNKEESEARNIKIQGTQADMIKECTVELQKWIDDNDYTNEITILSWVHDEIVDQHPKWMDGKSNEWEDYKNEQASNYSYPMTFDEDNPPLFEYNNNWYSSFPELKAQLMRDVCNKYLVNVKMDVDYDVEDYWTK